MGDNLSQKLRNKANDLYRVDGETMKKWDEIRKMVETMKGSDMPRMMFEDIIEELADLMIDAANAIERT